MQPSSIAWSLRACFLSSFGHFKGLLIIKCAFHVAYSHIRRSRLIHSTYSNSRPNLVCSECLNEHFARRTDCLKLVFQSSGVHICPVFHVNSRFYHVFPAHPLPLQLSTSPLVLIWLPKEPQHGVVLGQHFSPL